MIQKAVIVNRCPRYELCESVPKITTILNTSNEAVEAQTLGRNVAAHLSEIDSSTCNEFVEMENDATILMKKKISLAKTIARKLFLKYIQTGSEYEINISYAMRDDFEKTMNDYDTWMSMEHSPHDLVSLFAQTQRELFTLLRYSFSRYRVASNN